MIETCEEACRLHYRGASDTPKVDVAVSLVEPNWDPRVHFGWSQGFPNKRALIKYRNCNKNLMRIALSSRSTFTKHPESIQILILRHPKIFRWLNDLYQTEYS